MKKVVVVGGGAAGFFFSLNLKEFSPETEVIIFEKSPKLLSKVKISGGGRCNVTNGSFDPVELVKAYPRGRKELIGPFNKFNPKDIIEWFAVRSIELKTEDDGRVFPISNSSQTIIDCFMSETEKHNVKIYTNKSVVDFVKSGDGWNVLFSDKSSLLCDVILFAPGSSNSLWNLFEQKGHTIIPPVPSLFSFNCNDKLIKNLQGVSVDNCLVEINGTNFSSSGTILVTHWGLSGPAILSLSSFAARTLNQLNYNFSVSINWLNKSEEETFKVLKKFKTDLMTKSVTNSSPLKLPKRLWEKFLDRLNLSSKKWNDISNNELLSLAKILTGNILTINGKSTNKDEFVTAGGIALKEINFKTMESKLLPNIYFSGEFIDIDAITGGFNFQAAWTTAFIAAKSVSDI